MFFIFIDILILLLPVFILNLKVTNINRIWYFLCMLLNIISSIDPFMTLNFLPHKITTKRKAFY